MNKLINHLVTGIDGETYAIGRILWIIAFFVFIGLSIYTVLVTGLFNYMDFGLAVAAILGGGGLGVKVTETSEPKAKDE